MTNRRTFALIPAAGQSHRMGRPKLLLPLGERTVVERVVDAFRQAGVDTILVVAGPDMPELVQKAEQAGAFALRLGAPTPTMRATVEHGLAWLEIAFMPQPQDGWLLCPADHPTLRSAVVSGLLEARAAHPQRSVFIPTFANRRGHPALVGWQHVPAIRQRPVEEGLNIYLRQQADQTLLLPVPWEDVLLDLDTPVDYARMLESAW
jgi:molybdenum cofactor cytidylyltransferase